MRRSLAVLLAAAGIALAACSPTASGSPVAGSLGPIGSAAAAGSAGASGSASRAPASQAPATPAATAVVYPICSGPKLPARILAWTSGAGHRTASVEVTNAGTSPCRMRALDRPQLIDGHGSVLLDGSDPPATTAYINMTAGAVYKTSVDATNYCGPTPDGPISLAFVFPGGNVRFTATPLSPTDTSGLPPCLGAPGSAGTITMTLWVPG